MKGFLGYTIVVVTSGIVCGSLDHYNYMVEPSLYWVVGCVTGIAAMHLMYKG